MMLCENLICVMRRLTESGYEAYAVGGCVRDVLLGKEPVDFDIATNALPEQTKAAFADFKTIDTGIKHGTVTVMAYGVTAEVTTYRTDGTYSDCRHPDGVRFSKTLDEDLKRRDFTMNAVACNTDGEIVDLFGGTEDMKNGIIRCVGNADTRFTEDALRILRALRFSATLRFGIEDKTAKAVHVCAPLIENISAERIFSEIKKLISGSDAVSVMAQFSDVFMRVLPELKADYGLSVGMLKNSDGDFCIRFAALMYPCGADAARSALRRLKADNKTTARVCSALSADISQTSSNRSEILRLLCQYGSDALCDALRLKSAYCRNAGDRAGVEKWDGFAKKVKAAAQDGCYKVSHLAVNGGDVMRTFGVTGSDVGEKLKELLFDVMDGKIANKRSELLKKRE